MQENVWILTPDKPLAKCTERALFILQKKWEEWSKIAPYGDRLIDGNLLGLNTPCRFYGQREDANWPIRLGHYDGKVNK